jgi:hypothetical protein
MTDAEKSTTGVPLVGIEPGLKKPYISFITIQRRSESIRPRSETGQKQSNKGSIPIQT